LGEQGVEDRVNPDVVPAFANDAGGTSLTL
jgi:hypothetical protein